MKRRSFFKSFMGLVATVALAPEIAFGTKLSLPSMIHPAWETAPYDIRWWLSDDGKWRTTEEYVQLWRYRCAEGIAEFSKPYSDLQRLRREAGLSH